MSLQEKVQKEQKQKLSLVEWCDTMVSQDKELKMVWDGGNDSGWVYFEIDEETIENEYTEKLVNYMYDHLDYGSWAGDFSAQGEAIYNSTEKAFVGTDYYSETDTMSYTCNIPVTIPKNLWFNDLEIHIEVNSADESPEATVNFGIQNGFLTDDHAIVEQELVNYIEKEAKNAIEGFIDTQGEQFESMWETITFTPADFEEDGQGNLVAVINCLDMRYHQVEDKDIFLDIDRIQHEINEEK
jgi:hypothetical protein